MFKTLLLSEEFCEYLACANVLNFSFTFVGIEIEKFPEESVLEFSLGMVAANTELLNTKNIPLLSVKNEISMSVFGILCPVRYPSSPI